MGCEVSRVDCQHQIPEGIIFYKLKDIRKTINNHICCYSVTRECTRLNPYVHYSFDYSTSNPNHCRHNRVRCLTRKVAISEQTVEFHVNILNTGDYEDSCCIGLRKEQWEHFGIGIQKE